MRFYPNSPASKFVEYNHNHNPKNGEFSSGSGGVMSAPPDKNSGGGPRRGEETWAPSPRAKFKVGDRVQHSEHSLRHDREYIQQTGRSDIKASLQRQLDEKIAQRGTVIGAGDNGYALGASVQWDHGALSNSMEHMLAPAETAPSTQNPAPARTSSGEMIDKHPFTDEMHLDPAYTQRYRTAANSKWNISSRDVLTDPSLMKRAAPFSTMRGSDHKNLAAHFDNLAKFAQEKHQAVIRSGEAQFGTNGAVISGGFHQDWPETVKDQARKYAHATTAYRDAANAHRKAYLSARRRFKEDGTWKTFIESATSMAEGAGKVHTDKFDRCVQKVKARGGVDSPYAICQASLGAGAIRPAHRKTV